MKSGVGVGLSVLAVFLFAGLAVPAAHSATQAAWRDLAGTRATSAPRCAPDEPGTAELPPGHPPVGDNLPPGHPPVSRLPPGHPPVGGDALPPGHPPVEGPGADRIIVAPKTLDI